DAEFGHFAGQGRGLFGVIRGHDAAVADGFAADGAQHVADAAFEGLGGEMEHGQFAGAERGVAAARQVVHRRLEVGPDRFEAVVFAVAPGRQDELAEIPHRAFHGLAGDVGTRAGLAPAEAALVVGGAHEDVPRDAAFGEAVLHRQPHRDLGHEDLESGELHAAPASPAWRRRSHSSRSATSRSGASRGMEWVWSWYSSMSSTCCFPFLSNSITPGLSMMRSCPARKTRMGNSFRGSWRRRWRSSRRLSMTQRAEAWCRRSGSRRMQSRCSGMRVNISGSMGMGTGVVGRRRALRRTCSLYR